MNDRVKSVVVFAAGVALFSAAPVSPAHAQEADKGVELVVTFGQGSAADVIARILAQAAEKYLGEPVRVSNRVADTGAEGYRYVKDAKPDGRAIVWNSAALLTLYHQGKLDFDYKSFAPVARVTVDTLSLVAAPDAEWKDLRAFVEYARKNPGAKVGHEGPGTFAHLVAASLENAAGIKLTHVQTGATPATLQAMSEKKIDVSSQAIAGIAGPAREGKVRILGVSGEARSPSFPDAATFKEQGVPMAMDIWRGLGAPKGTPPARIAKLEAAFEQASQDASFVEASKKYGFAIRYMKSADFAKLMDEQDRMLSGVLEKVGLKTR